MVNGGEKESEEGSRRLVGGVPTYGTLRATEGQRKKGKKDGADAARQTRLGSQGQYRSLSLT